MSIRAITLALFLVGVFLAMHGKPLHAQAPTRQLWHIAFTDQTDLNRLAAELDVWEVDHATHTLLAPLTREEADALRQTHQITLAPDQSPLMPSGASAAQTNGIPNFECYRTVDESFATLDTLAENYPQLVEQRDIGDSWDKGRAGGSPGDDLRVLVITNQAVAGPKFRFFLMGAIHAREYTTAELALRFAESLLTGYGSDADTTWLLDHGELHLLTIANPDGRRVAETGILWRKNRNSDAACEQGQQSGDSFGVDLNRNSSFKWAECDGFGCSSADSCRETYRGEAPASEPEVAAIQTYLRTIFPDQRGEALDESAPLTTQGLFVSLHSYGRLVLFPWGYTTAHAPNAYGLATLARRIGHPLRYTVCQAGGAGCLYQTDGTTDDFGYGDLGLPSFTIELGTSFFQSCTYFENSILEQGLAALRYAFAAAPLPYQLPEGPEIRNLSITPQTIGTGAEVSVTISATADATRIAPLSGSNVLSITEPMDEIRAARLTIDQLPWQGTPYSYALPATDGLFNSAQEAITSTLELACLPTGRHTLYVQAEDVQGDMGIVAADFVTVTNSAPFTITVNALQAAIKATETATYTLLITNTSATTTTYAIEPLAANGITILPSQPVTVAAGISAQVKVALMPQNSTADTSVPAVFKVRSIADPTQCRQVQVTTQVDAWNYQQRLIYIAKR